MLKKSSDFLGKTNSEVVIFLGMKYEPLSDPPSSRHKNLRVGPLGRGVTSRLMAIAIKFRTGCWPFMRSAYKRLVWRATRPVNMAGCMNE